MVWYCNPLSTVPVTPFHQHSSAQGPSPFQFSLSKLLMSKFKLHMSNTHTASSATVLPRASLVHLLILLISWRIQCWWKNKIKFLSWLFKIPKSSGHISLPCNFPVHKFQWESRKQQKIYFYYLHLGGQPSINMENSNGTNSYCVREPALFLLMIKFMSTIPPCGLRLPSVAFGGIIVFGFLLAFFNMWLFSVWHFFFLEGGMTVSLSYKKHFRR